jgi:hypothetical protein
MGGGVYPARWTGLLWRCTVGALEAQGRKDSSKWVSRQIREVGGFWASGPTAAGCLWKSGSGASAVQGVGRFFSTYTKNLAGPWWGMARFLWKGWAI